jgi:hypothetical protein
MMKISLDLLQKPNIELNLLKTNSNISGITRKYLNLNLAYNHFLPIKQEKYENVKKSFKLYLILRLIKHNVLLRSIFEN